MFIPFKSHECRCLFKNYLGTTEKFCSNPEFLRELSDLRTLGTHQLQPHYPFNQFTLLYPFHSLVSASQKNLYHCLVLRAQVIARYIYSIRRDTKEYKGSSQCDMTGGGLSSVQPPAGDPTNPGNLDHVTDPQCVFNTHSLRFSSSAFLLLSSLQTQFIWWTFLSKTLQITP